MGVIHFSQNNQNPPNVVQSNYFKTGKSHHYSLGLALIFGHIIHIPILFLLAAHIKRHLSLRNGRTAKWPSLPFAVVVLL